MKAVLSIIVHTYFPLDTFLCKKYSSMHVLFAKCTIPFNFAGKLQHGDYSKHRIVPFTQSCHKPDTVNDEIVPWDVTEYYKFAICLHI